MESFCNHEVITLVGSSRFKFAFQMVEAELVQQNNTLVYSLPVFSHAEGAVLTDEQIKMLKDQQKERIANSTCVYVVDVGGYIGDDTREEIAYAESLGLKIRYLSKEHPVFATSLELSMLKPISHQSTAANTAVSEIPIFGEPTEREAPKVTFTSEHSVTKFLSDWKAAIAAGQSVDYTGSIDISHNLVPMDTAASEGRSFLHSVERVDGQLTVSGDDPQKVQQAFNTLNVAYEDMVLEDRFHKLEGPTWADPKKRALATIEDLTTALGAQDYRLAMRIARDLHEHLSGCHIDTINQ